MGHRNPRIGRHGQRRGHSGHLLKGNAVFFQKFQLLAASPEQERVAALQPHNLFALQSLFQQNPVDFLLGHRVIAGLLAYVDFLGSFRNQAQNFRANQPVVDHHLRPAKNLQSFPGEQPRVAGACAYQNDTSRFHWPSPSLSWFASACPSCSACSRGPLRAPLRCTDSSALT